MSKLREIRTYDYVNQPYETVRLALLTDPKAIFHEATVRGAEAAAISELRVRVGAVEIGAQIEIDVTSAQPARAPLGKPAYSIAFRWSSPKHPGWFPTMNATLTMYALTPTETQLDFDGVYVPPLGVFGTALDSLALHRFAEASVAGFLHEVAMYLRDALSRPRAAAAPTAP